MDQRGSPSKTTIGASPGSLHSIENIKRYAGELQNFLDEAEPIYLQVSEGL